MHGRAAQLIETLDLRPHPEGGYYRELFRSRTLVAPGDERGARPALTTIYFLLTADMRSRWHRVLSDEVWHLYEGGPLELLELELPQYRLTKHRLAAVGENDAFPVHTIAAGVWQAAHTLSPYTLVGCTVAPGFDFADFRLLADDAEHAAVVRARWPDLVEFI
jgi:predicted cupin superfamily sugar epimerase